MRINVGHIWPTPKSFLRAVERLPDRNGHRVFSLECSVCSQDPEMWPPGSIVGRVIKLNSGAVPCGCSESTKWPEAQNQLRAERAAGKAGLKIERWITDRRLVLRCSLHGAFEKSLKHLVTSGTGCLPCRYSSLRLPESELARRLSERQDESGIRVDGGLGDRLALACPIHGRYETSIDTFVRQKCGCPSCAFGGFKPHRRAALYLLKSECQAYLKVGITGGIKKRMQKLRLETPFSFRLVQVVRLNGFTAARLERQAHAQFESAGLCGFDGATEWLKTNPAVLTFIQANA